MSDKMTTSVLAAQALHVSLSEKVLSQVQENLYELAKKDGFSGSLTEFLGSLKVQGDNGVTFIPKIENGVLSWENNGGLPNPEPLLLANPELPKQIEQILNHGAENEHN